MPDLFYMMSYWKQRPSAALRCFALELPNPRSSYNALVSSSSSSSTSPEAATYSIHPFSVEEEAPSLLLKLLQFCNSSSRHAPLCVHSPLIKLCLWEHLTLPNNLLSLYSRCSSGPRLARQLFEDMRHRDLVSWTALISTYARTGNRDGEALHLFHEMRRDFNPNEFTFSSVLRCVSSLRALQFGASLHALLIKCGLSWNEVLCTALIDLYSKCHRLQDASHIFTSMGDRDAVSWTAMISAHVEAGDCCHALNMYSSMMQSGTYPSQFTFAKLLQACASLQSHYGHILHAHIIVLGLELNLILKTALVTMYSKLHNMEEALKVFNLTPDADVILWTALLSGYTQLGDYEAAIKVFFVMEQYSGVSLNSYTYAGLLSTCSAAPLPELGMQLHSRIVKVGFQHDTSVGNALVDLYAKHSPELVEPLHAFEEIRSPNVVSWTALIAAFSCNGRDIQAFDAFMKMRVAGIEPNSFTLSALFRSCTSTRVLPDVEKLHAYAMRTGWLFSHLIVGNSLVDVYARFGRAEDAWKFSKAMPYRDLVTYTSLARGWNQMGLHRRALDVISHIQSEDVKMDGFSLASFLCACAGIAAGDWGKQLHCHSLKCNLNSWISVSNSLVDMYSKCGSIDEARKVFALMHQPNVISWNGLISGLAANGRFSEALSTFEDMRLAGTQPDEITFLLVLYACSHGGMLDLGLDYFDAMGKLYGVAPQIDHYICMVDMLGRAGRLEEAYNAIEGMPFKKNALVYKTLLSACKLHRNMVLAEFTARQALQLEPDPAVYVLLASIYDDAGRQDLGEQTRWVLRDRYLMKSPGQSWMVMQKR